MNGVDSMNADQCNGAFEFLGALLVLNNCRVVVHDKAVKGVSILSTLLFSVWGAWNLFYYPWLHQWYSFGGGAVLTWANSVYVLLLITYSSKNIERT